MASASAVIVIADDSSDEEVAIISSTVARKRRGKPPEGVDAASWWLIQKLQEEEEDGDVVEVASPSKNRRTQRHRDTVHRAPLDWKRHREERDRAVAAKMQEEEERKKKDQEIMDKAVAQQFQQDEEERNRKLPAMRHHHLSKDEVLMSLRPCQLQAVKYVKTKAKSMHDKALQRVEDRVIGLGFMSDDLHGCLDYIREDAPIVIHLQPQTLSLLVKDTHYRNLFETNSSGGTKDTRARAIWESDMFGNAYSKRDCQPFDRPKYGCLNISGDIAGVNSARYYGNFFMILHQHVRHRCTFFNKDTGAFVRTETLATNEYYAHILDGYDDADLTTALNISQSARVGGAKSHCTTYKEVQIHGPVCLATDIQALSISCRERTASKKLKADVLEFQKIANCNVLWQDDLLDPEDEDDTA